MHDTLPQDDALPYQVWLPQVERFRRYGQSQTEGQMDRHGDSSVLAPPQLCYRGMINKNNQRLGNKEKSNSSHFQLMSLFFQDINLGH